MEATSPVKPSFHNPSRRVNDGLLENASVEHCRVRFFGGPPSLPFPSPPFVRIGNYSTGTNEFVELATLGCFVPQHRTRFRLSVAVPETGSNPWKIAIWLAKKKELKKQKQPRTLQLW